MATVSVTLLDPIPGHTGMIERLVIREPKARDRWEIGDLMTWSPSDNGMIAIEHSERYSSYLERCLQEPADKTLVLGQLSMADSLQVEKVIDDFFAAARRKASPPLPSSSSSSAGSTSTPSAS